MPTTTSVSTPTVTTPRENGQRAGKPQARKTRVVRRRGRAAGGLESDEEIEREVGSDESDASDSPVSDSDASDSEAEDDTQGGRAVTPSTTQSPPLPDNDEAKGAKAHSATAAPGPFQRGAINWSEMVADEDTNGAGELPVIDFADLGAEPAPATKPATQPRLAKAKSKVPNGKPPPEGATAPTPPSAPANGVSADGAGSSAAPTQSALDAETHGPRTTARQAYQDRLEKDPSYVPVIGEFWGHDDRLLDKSVRSMSGWWQGRWQRGRGRGGFPPRGRGRGAYNGGPGHFPPNDQEQDGTAPEQPVEAFELPPIEKAWTHDKFEEMKRRDDHRKQADTATRGGFTPFRGAARGAFTPRGRGGFSHGGFAPNASRAAGFSAVNGNEETTDTSRPPADAVPRIWYSMKPERVWTKQHEAFLYLDSALKPRPGVGPGYRVRVPGGEGDIVRARPQPYRTSRTTPPRANAVPPSVTFIVRLPGKRKEKLAVSVTPDEPVVEEPVTTVEPIVDDLPARPVSVASSATRPAPPVVLPNASSQPSPASSALNAPSRPAPAPAPPAPPIQVFPRQVLESNQLGIDIGIQPTPGVHVPEGEVPNPPAPAGIESGIPESDPHPPPLPPIAIPSFSPAPQPIPQQSPSFGSPYAYPVALPPGIAVNQHGMPYEVSTGRPVFLPAAGAPPSVQQPQSALYTPPPPGIHHVPHAGAVPFVPGHMHHPSVTSPAHPYPHHAHSHSHHGSIGSPDFFAPHARPAAYANIVEYSTGRPIFAPPRQSSRIEIRAPGEDGKMGSAPPKTTSPAHPSGLRSGFVAPQEGMSPSTQSAEGNAHHTAPPLHAQAPMMYAPYAQQQYYYPEQYGYQPYVDMSQMQQYDGYPPQEHVQQGVVYY